MDVDPQLIGLSARVGEIAVRNTASAVLDRVQASKARRKNDETIAELEELIDSLMSDKNELIQVARAYEDEIVAQQISQDDIDFITTNLVPVLRELAEAGGGADADQDMDQFIDLVTKLISTETVTLLQLLGFNFKQAIGEPLTGLVSALIDAQRPPQGNVAEQAALLSAQRDVLAFQVALDPDAAERLGHLFSR